MRICCSSYHGTILMPHLTSRSYSIVFTSAMTPHPTPFPSTHTRDHDRPPPSPAALLRSRSRMSFKTTTRMYLVESSCPLGISVLINKCLCLRQSARYKLREAEWDLHNIRRDLWNLHAGQNLEDFNLHQFGRSTSV